jgi:hypothetical protein
MAFLDIIRSYIIKGAIILIILRVMLGLQSILMEQTERAVLAEELSTTSFTFASDMRLAGYDSSATGIDTLAFTIAETSRVEIKGNINNTGPYELVKYDLSPMPSSTKFYLQRTVNGGTPLQVGRNLTKFYLTYYNNVGNKLLSPVTFRQIRSIDVLMTMESNTMFDNRYPVSSRQARIFPKNLN